MAYYTAAWILYSWRGRRRKKPTSGLKRKAIARSRLIFKNKYLKKEKCVSWVVFFSFWVFFCETHQTFSWWQAVPWECRKIKACGEQHHLVRFWVTHNRHVEHDDRQTSEEQQAQQTLTKTSSLGPQKSQNCHFWKHQLTLKISVNNIYLIWCFILLFGDYFLTSGIRWNKPSKKS